MAPLPKAIRRAAKLALSGATVIVSLVASLSGSTPALAEFQVGVYAGWKDNFDSDVALKQPNGTNMTLHDVAWDGASFESPPYWGIRATYWFANNPNWGLMFDYNHAKVISDKGAVVGVSGTRDGIPVGPTDRVGNTFQVMEFTDGLNEFFFGAQYRWLHERWTPYVGLA